MPVTRTQLAAAAQSASGARPSRQHTQSDDENPLATATTSSSSASPSSSSRSSGRATRLQVQRLQQEQQQQQQRHGEDDKEQRAPLQRQQQSQQMQSSDSEGSTASCSASVNEASSSQSATMLDAASTELAQTPVLGSSHSELGFQADQKALLSHYAKQSDDLLASTTARQASISQPHQHQHAHSLQNLQPSTQQQYPHHHHHHHHHHQPSQDQSQQMSSSSQQQHSDAIASFSSTGILSFSSDTFDAASAAAAAAAAAGAGSTSMSSQVDSQHIDLDSFKESALGATDIQSHPAWSGFMNDIYLHGQAHFGGSSQGQHSSMPGESSSQTSPSDDKNHRQGLIEGRSIQSPHSSTPQHSGTRALSNTQLSPDICTLGEGALGLANASRGSIGDDCDDGNVREVNFAGTAAQWTGQSQRHNRQQVKQATHSAPVDMGRYPQAPVGDLSPTPVYRASVDAGNAGGSPGAASTVVMRGNEHSMRAFHRQARSLGQVGAALSTSNNGLLHLGGPLTPLGDSSLTDRFGMVDTVSSSSAGAKVDLQRSAQFQSPSDGQMQSQVPQDQLQRTASTTQRDLSPDVSMTARSMSPSDNSIASATTSNILSRSHRSIRSPRTSDSTATNRTMGDTSFDTSIDSSTSSIFPAPTATPMATTSTSASVSRASSTSDEFTSQSMSWTSSSQLTSVSEHKRTSSTASSRSTTTKSVRGKSRLRNIDRKRICQYAVEHPELKQEELAKHFGIERSTVSKTLKNKESWLTISEEGSGALIVKHRTGKFPEIESELAAWAVEETKRGNILLDHTIKNRALEIARLNGFGIGEFKASVGWIDKFRDRNKIPKTVADLNNMSSQFNNLPHLMPHARTDAKAKDVAQMQPQDHHRRESSQVQQAAQRESLSLGDMTSMMLRQENVQPHRQRGHTLATMQIAEEESEAADEISQLHPFASPPDVLHSRPTGKSVMSRTRSTSDIAHTPSRPTSSASGYEASGNAQATPKASKRHYDLIGDSKMSSAGDQEQPQVQQQLSLQHEQTPHPMATPAFRHANDRLQAALEQSPGLRQYLEEQGALPIASSSSAPQGWSGGDLNLSSGASSSSAKRRRGDERNHALHGSTIRRTRSEEQSNAHDDVLSPSDNLSVTVTGSVTEAAQEARRMDKRRSQRTLRASPRQGALQENVSATLNEPASSMRLHSPLHTSPRRGGSGANAMSGLFGRHRERTSSSSTPASRSIENQGDEGFGEDGGAQERVVSLEEARDSLDCVLSYLANSNAVLSPSDYFMLGNLQGMLSSLANDRSPSGGGSSSSSMNANRSRVESGMARSLSSAVDQREASQRSSR